jgi:hypothetical protein
MKDISKYAFKDVITIKTYIVNRNDEEVLVKEEKIISKDYDKIYE